MATFHVENFGCRATQADGAAIERQLLESGLTAVQEGASAEFAVLNTCTVTASADQDARAAIRRIHRENPECKIVVTGCYAQRAPEEIASLPGVFRVIGNSHKHQLAEFALAAGSVTLQNFVALESLSEANTPSNIFVSDIFAHTELLAAPVFEASRGRTRPNLKVQDGCDNRCSFCVIPSVRGHSRSLPLPRVVQEVNSLVEAGYREVVISGINLGRWGRDLKDSQRFETLVRAILAETDLEKLRISSVEPMDWSDELIALVAGSRRIAKHAHVPLQSGSDKILRAMHRKYRPWHYREKIEKIRAAMPEAAIGADVMTGFPGETESDFDATRSLIEDLPVTYLHVFTYSPRPGTASATMAGQVPVEIARERNQVLRNLAAKKKRDFMQSFAGRSIPAITLDTVRGGEEEKFTEALADNFLKVRLRGIHEPNRWIPVRAVCVDGDALIAECSDQHAAACLEHSSPLKTHSA